MAETIETQYTEADVTDLRNSGHWPARDELETQAEANEAAGTPAPSTGKRSADPSAQPA